MRNLPFVSWNPLFLMGIFLVIAQLFIFSAVVHDPSRAIFLFWSCNNFGIFLLIACYRSDIQMFKGISYLGLVSQLLWILDFCSHTVGFDVSGIADYVYLEGLTYANEVSIGVHLLVPLTVLVFCMSTRPTFASLGYAVLYSFTLGVVTIWWTPNSMVRMYRIEYFYGQSTPSYR